MNAYFGYKHRDAGRLNINQKKKKSIFFIFFNCNELAI